ncbi:MAG: hypothetical protein ACI86X_002593 [Moritella sp.]|jgi:hypothetical protein
MSYKLVLLSELKTADLKMVIRPYIAVDIIREIHLQHAPIQVWDLDWHNDSAAFLAPPERKYDRIIEKLVLGHLVLLKWPQAQMEGVIDHRGQLHPSMQLGIGNALLSDKVTTLQQSAPEKPYNSPSSESKAIPAPLVAPVKAPVASAGRNISDAVAEGPFELEVELLDQDEEPVANADYILRLQTGEELTGQLDGDGYKLFSGHEYKQSQIHFPEYEGHDWVRGAASKRNPQTSSVAQKQAVTEAPVEEPALIEFKLLDHDDAPMANAEYLVTLTSGDEMKGQLDADGYVQLCGTEYKNAKICFPEFDGGDWS